MSVKVLNTEDFESEISAGRTVVDFYADWCGPCRMLAPAIEELSNSYTDVSFCKLNVDEAGSIAASLGIDSIPCVILFENGEEKGRSVGYVSAQKLTENIGL